MSRATDLVELAAAAMDRGEDPFHHGFLCEHEVTLDEAYDLSETLALAARLYLVLRKHPEQLTVLLVEVGCGSDAAKVAAASIGLRKITKALKAL